MGTPGDPVAIERDGISAIGRIRGLLEQSNVACETYFDPYDPGHHGSVSWDVMQYPDVGSAVERARNFDG